MPAERHHRGKIKIGNKSVPISKPLVLSGGTELEGANFSYNSKGGLSPTKLLVPGGVIGLTGLDWLINFLSIQELQLYAEAQLAGRLRFSALKMCDCRSKFT